MFKKIAVKNRLERLNIIIISFNEYIIKYISINILLIFYCLNILIQMYSFLRLFRFYNFVLFAKNKFIPTYDYDYSSNNYRSEMLQITIILFLKKSNIRCNKLIFCRQLILLVIDKERSELCSALFITLAKSVFAFKSRFRISLESHDKALSCSL